MSTTDQVTSGAGSQTIDVVRAGVSYKFGEPARIASVPYAKAPPAQTVSMVWRPPRSATDGVPGTVDAVTVVDSTVPKS